jgi:shikimate 5-dehydrogenase
VSGLDLLVHQAVRQVRLMTGRDDPRLLEVVRAAGRDALAR